MTTDDVGLWVGDERYVPEHMLKEALSALRDLTMTAQLVSETAGDTVNRGTTYDDLQEKIVRWACERKIIPNSSPLAQAIKSLEEVTELLSATNRNFRGEMKDAYGDVMVTLIIGATLAGFDPLDCLQHAYDQIKDRTGTLRSDGVFVKDQSGTLPLWFLDINKD